MFEPSASKQQAIRRTFYTKRAMLQVAMIFTPVLEMRVNLGINNSAVKSGLGSADYDALALGYVCTHLVAYDVPFLLVVVLLEKLRLVRWKVH